LQNETTFNFQILSLSNGGVLFIVDFSLTLFQIIVFSKYFTMSLPIIPTSSTCEKCCSKYTNVAYNWCKPCQINKLKENFMKWTSENKEIDDIIKEQQIKIKTHHDIIIEWIPYNKFNIIKKIGGSNYPIAIWNEGPLKFNKNTKKYERISKEKVALIYKNNSVNIINEFSNEVNIKFKCYFYLIPFFKHYLYLYINIYF
jgi:hypothetical protein